MTAGVATSERWHWLDWIRVLSMAAIFLFHCGMPFFLFDSWHIVNSQQDLAISLLNLFIIPWIMPLFFVISGIATYLSLSRRSPGQFVRDRFKRLMVPFLVAGLLLVLPIHVYFSHMSPGAFLGSFPGFYIGPYFRRFFPFTTEFSATYFADTNQGIYLWYIFWLFVFSIVTVHLFKWLIKPENRAKISRLASVTSRRGGIFLLAIPIILVNVIAVRPFFVFPSGYGGGKLPTFLAFFVAAYLLATSPKLRESLDRNRHLALLLGIGTSSLIFLILATFGIGFFASPYLPYYLTTSVVWVLNGWSWAIAILAFGRRRLSGDHKFLRFASELVLPFYILHEAIIVAVASFVVDLELFVLGKYLIIILVSFSIIAALLLVIRRFNVLRFLFGMRSRKGKVGA